MSRFIVTAVMTALFAWQIIMDRPPTPTPTPIAYPAPEIVLSDAVIEHILEVYERGQTLGNRANVFSKIGDSITTSYQFLYPIGFGQYQLGAYDALEPMITFYSRTNARVGNSFSNPSLAARVGWSAYGALNPENSDPETCEPEELPLICEYRLVRPSVALIMFGTNDAGYADLRAYRYNINRIVQISLNMGVIPVISTIPDRPAVSQNVILFNDAVRDVAEENSIPLWDYHAALQSLPDLGLAADQVHPSYPPEDEATTTNFSATYLQYGYNVRNLTALQMLYAIWWHTQFR